MSNEPILTLDETAAVMAHLAYFGGGHLPEILERKDVAPTAWQESSAHWNEQMVEAAMSREYALHLQFSDTFGDIKRRLEQEEVRIEDIGPRPEKVDDTAAAVPAVTDEPPSAPHAKPEPPPVARSSPAAPPGVPLATALGSPPPAASSPWARSTPTSPRPPVEAPRVAASSPDVTADAVTAVPAELPFAEAVEAHAPTPAAGTVEGHELAGGTSFVSALSDEQLEPSTPFGRSSSPARPEAVEGGDVEGTAFMMAPFQDEPLPFEGENPAPPPAASERSHDAAGATAFVPAVDATPSAPMSPEAYARLVHATYQKPAAERDKVHRAQQLDERKRTQLDAAMASYMKREPEAFGVYMQWVHHLRSGGE